MAGLAALSRLTVAGIRKAFAATRALEEVSFTVRPGTIHAVLGENGAGKSTLMKIIAGALRADQGTLTLDGAAYAPADPLAARRLGVSIVYQELSVCSDLTVAENVMLGMEPHRLGWVDRGAELARVRRALDPLTGSRPIDPGALVSTLSAAERQLVEIARALASEKTRLLILDEPTSSLAHDDVKRLFAALARLREGGLSILYISHFLEEVRQIAAEYTVLRDGRSVASGEVSATTNEELVTLMAGKAITTRQRSERRAGETLLSVSRLSGARFPVSADLNIQSGEVLGIAGLLGSGRTELLRAIFGLDVVKSGEVRVRGLVHPSSPAASLARGVGLLSEDRKSEGLLLELSVADNLTISKLRPLKRFGLLSRRRAAAVVSEWTARLGVRLRDADQRVSELSGGNQQKVALARLLYHDVDVLLLDEPTRGIDVRSRSEIHGWIDELCARGKAVLLVSSQLPELLALSDRIAIMHRGVLGPARPVGEWSEQTLLLEATGS